MTLKKRLTDAASMGPEYAESVERFKKSKTLCEVFAAEDKPKHGGARRNSGRKKSGRKAYLIRMKPATMAVLRSQAKADSLTVGELLESQYL